MKKISKIFGAAAIVGLFLLSAVTVTTAAPAARAPAAQNEELPDGGCILMTDEEEIEYGVEPAGVSGLIWPDLFPVGIDVDKTNLLKKK